MTRPSRSPEFGGTDDEDNWWTDDPFCYGYLCSFDRLVIDDKTSTDVEATWQIIDALLKRIRRRMAVKVLKAFPLDYEGEVTAENRPVFERRQRALIRLYQRRIRFEPVPHKALADQGWMLRLFNEGARPDASDRPRTPATKKRQTRSTVLLLGRR